MCEKSSQTHELDKVIGEFGRNPDVGSEKIIKTSDYRGARRFVQKRAAQGRGFAAGML